EETRTRPARSLQDLLNANKDNTIELLMHDREEPPLRGRILNVLRGGDLGTPAPLPSMEMHSAAIWPPTQQVLVHVSLSDGGEAIIPVSSIISIRGENLRTDIEETLTTRVDRKRLTVQFPPETAGKSVEVTLLHIAPGLQWTPTY